MSEIVFDTTCLSHFARASRLDELERITQDFDRFMPNEVAAEIQRGVADHPALGAVFSLGWLAIVELQFPELVYFAEFKAELGGHPLQHLGECAVLARVKEHGGIGIVDDSAARATAEHHELTVRGTLSLIASGLTSGIIDQAVATALVDDLHDTDMRLPVDGAGFIAWAYTEGLLK